MTEKILKIKHHVDDYECMWNGIEDVYSLEVDQQLPDFFFFTLFGVGDFIYLKKDKSPASRFAVWSDGRTEKMYQKLKSITEFDFHYIKNRTFSYAMKKAKQRIESGKPVVLGPLDMYYLEYYPKLYLQEHIPIHYVLMVGYNDIEGVAYIQDCGVEEVQEISYELLEQAMRIDGTKNTICLFDFGNNLLSPKELAVKALLMKANNQLQDKLSFLGIKGMRKLAAEFNQWPKKLAIEEYKAALSNLIMFTGEVPILPDQLLSKSKQTGIKHLANRNQLVKVLEFLEEYDFSLAIKCFTKSGWLIQKMTDQITSYLLNEIMDLDEVAELITQIADLEEMGYQELIRVLN